MFVTDYLEGRIIYETEKVVCFNVHLASVVNQSRPFMAQVLFSLVNGKYNVPKASFYITKGDDTFQFTEKDFENELDKGIALYKEARKELGLD